MFDDDGNLVLPKDAFKNEVMPKGEWKVECPYCGHKIRMRAWKPFTKCKECHRGVYL